VYSRTLLIFLDVKYLDYCDPLQLTGLSSLMSLVKRQSQNAFSSIWTAKITNLCRLQTFRIIILFNIVVLTEPYFNVLDFL